MPGGDRERADVVAGRRDVVGEASGSAASRRTRTAGAGSRIACRCHRDNDVVAVGRRRPEPVDAPRAEQPSRTISSSSSCASSYSSRAAGCSRIAGNLPFSSQAWKKNCQSMYSRSVGERRARPRARRERRRAAGRRTRRAARFARAASIDSSGLRSRSACWSRSRSCSSRFSVVEQLAPHGVEQVGDDADDARRVEHVDDRLRVLRRDPHRGVLPRGRRAADQQRQREPAALHLARDVDHLVERRRDQPRQADDVRADLARRVEDLVRRHHHAEVVHLVVVAAEHDADDVLADVVDVALHRREHDACPARAGRRPPPSPASMNGSR